MILDQNNTLAVAASAMDVGFSTITQWVKQFRGERHGKLIKGFPINPEQIEIREQKKSYNALKWKTT